MAFRSIGGGGGGVHAIDGADHTGVLDDAQIPGGIRRDVEDMATIFFGPPFGITGGSQWTNQPAGEQAWNGAAFMVWRGALDSMAQYRWQGNIWNAGVAGALLVLSYTTDWAAWNDIDTEELTARSFDTGWLNLPAGAKVDPVGIGIRGRNGNAVADPAIEQISVSFR